MLGVDEYMVNLLAALVHLRIFTMVSPRNFPIKDGHTFIIKASERVPHLEYFSLPHLFYKRVGGELVTCDRTEFPIG
jgi:hypothetical protein